VDVPFLWLAINNFISLVQNFISTNKLQIISLKKLLLRCLINMPSNYYLYDVKKDIRFNLPVI
jgi:hypothetical protein